MGAKYKVKKDDLRALFATADMMMEGNYDEYYKRLGWQKTRSGNYKCWNSAGHKDGDDAHPSLSVDPRKGVFNCFACGVKGNFQSYWKEYLKGGVGGESYTDFIIDFLGLASGGRLSFSTDTADPDYKKNLEELQNLKNELESEKFTQCGKKWILSPELTDMIKEATTIPMSIQDDNVERLLADDKSKEYLYDTRRITDDIIKRYRIGMNEKGKFIFPMINAEGSLINIKAYDPRGNPNFKWSYPYKGNDTCPTPMDNFTQQRLYFFGGEPDCYAGIASGIHGAVTLGSEAITDVDKIFGVDRARQIFGGKEIVICLDSDDTGVRQAVKLAEALYPYAKQIKIIDLDISDINPNGLDPNNVTEIQSGDKIKKKRNEKDFTDFMKKNGFGEVAKTMFMDLIRDTTVYTRNTDRVMKEIFKVTIPESRMPRYYSADGMKILESIASVSEFNSEAYMYPTKFQVSCKGMKTPKDVEGACERCSLPQHHDWIKGPAFLEFNFVREIPKEHSNNMSYIKIQESDILGLIEVTRPQKEQHQKRLCQINENCKSCIMRDISLEKLLHVLLTKDVNEYGDKSDTASTGQADIDVEAYMVLKDLYPNKSYKFESVLTTGWKNQQGVLFSHKAEPVATCIETFTMDQQTHDMLSVFKPKVGEPIQDALNRRYDAFSKACGAVGRHDVFFLNDLAFFSPIEIDCKILPGIKRGWIEVLIAGDTRTCKTMVTKWLRNHYKTGDMIAGSSAVTRSGLLGGMAKSVSSNKMHVVWGKIPMNDGGTIVIDELSNIDEKILSDLTGCRSDGVANITGIVSRQVLARVRKIMLSNQRAWTSESEKADVDGMSFIKKLCMKDEIISRFDLAIILRKDDVPMEEIGTSYEKLCSEFTEYQCQNLIRWAHSRTSAQVVYDEGFYDAVNESFVKMLKKFHPATQLVNQEMRAKLVRMSISVACMLYSIPDNDWNKVLVKKEHLEYVSEYVDKLYCSPNMGLDKYSERIWMHEKLGDMKFMENICKYIDINQLLRYGEFSQIHLQQVFCDYLERVQSNTLYMVDTGNDNRMSTGQKPYESIHKLVGTLVARNCLERAKKGGYSKTKQFNEWLSKRLLMGKDAPTSNILERVESEPNTKTASASDSFGIASR